MKFPSNASGDFYGSRISFIVAGLSDEIPRPTPAMNQWLTGDC
jgi:hypothetical protein